MQLRRKSGACTNVPIRSNSEMWTSPRGKSPEGYQGGNKKLPQELKAVILGQIQISTQQSR